MKRERYKTNPIAIEQVGNEIERAVKRIPDIVASKDYRKKNDIENELIARICDALLLEKSQLEAYITCYRDMSAADYIRQRRLLYGLWLKKEKEMSDDNVANEIGYSSFKTFSKAFKSRFGVTPAKAELDLLDKYPSINACQENLRINAGNVCEETESEVIKQESGGKERGKRLPGNAKYWMKGPYAVACVIITLILTPGVWEVSTGVSGGYVIITFGLGVFALIHPMKGASLLSGFVIALLLTSNAWLILIYTLALSAIFYISIKWMCTMLSRLFLGRQISKAN